MSNRMKEAERLSRVLEDIAQTALRGVDNEQIRGHLMDASALLAHIQCGVPEALDPEFLIGYLEEREDWRGREVLIERIRQASAPDHFRDAAVEKAWERFEAELQRGQVKSDAAGMVVEPVRVETFDAGFLESLGAEVPAPAEVPMPEPVAYGIGNTAITGHTNRLMMVRIVVPLDDQYAGAGWHPLVLADEARTYGERCRAAGESAGYARVLEWAVSGWKAEVENRPLKNKNRRSLDDVWRQVVRFAGGDPDALLGPSHDAILREETL